MLSYCDLKHWEKELMTVCLVKVIHGLLSCNGASVFLEPLAVLWSSSMYSLPCPCLTSGPLASKAAYSCGFYCDQSGIGNKCPSLLGTRKTFQLKGRNYAPQIFCKELLAYQCEALPHDCAVWQLSCAAFLTSAVFSSCCILLGSVSLPFVSIVLG